MKTSNVAPAKKTATVSEAYTKIIEEMRTPSKPRSLGQYYADWNEKAKKIAADEEAEAFFKNIKAEDVGVATGAAMTEEQFHAYRNRTSGPSYAEMYNAVNAAQRNQKKK